MKPKYHRHCCPACGQRVSWSRLNLRAWVWARWPCESCGTLLRFHLASRLLCGVLLAGWLEFTNLFVLRHVDVWVWFVILVVGTFAILRLDRIAEAKPSQSASKKEDLLALPRDA